MSHPALNLFQNDALLKIITPHAGTRVDTPTYCPCAMITEI